MLKNISLGNGLPFTLVHGGDTHLYWASLKQHELAEDMTLPSQAGPSVPLIFSLGQAQQKAPFE